MRLSWLGCRCMYLGIASARGDEFRLGEEGERWGQTVCLMELWVYKRVWSG